MDGCLPALAWPSVAPLPSCVGLKGAGCPGRTLGLNYFVIRIVYLQGGWILQVTGERLSGFACWGGTVGTRGVLLVGKCFVGSSWVWPWTTRVAKAVGRWTRPGRFCSCSPSCFSVKGTTLDQWLCLCYTEKFLSSMCPHRPHAHLFVDLCFYLIAEGCLEKQSLSWIAGGRGWE